MASIMAVLLIIENLLAYLSNRMYTSFDNINFLDGPERRRTRRKAASKHQYQRTEIDELPLQTYDAREEQDSTYTDPYDDHKTQETTLYS